MTEPAICLLDYGMGNLRSVEKALEHVGVRALRSSNYEIACEADGLILPGVGAFPRAMQSLRALGLADVLRERAASGARLLGICLGMQLLFASSSEHEGAAGLGLLPGEVTLLDAHGGKLPHIGWNRVTLERPSPLTAGLGEAAAFYHVHSYVCRPIEAGDVVGLGEHGERFASIVERDNVAGVQFHPEKSSRDGLVLLGNFVRSCARVIA